MGTHGCISCSVCGRCSLCGGCTCRAQSFTLPREELTFVPCGTEPTLALTTKSSGEENRERFFRRLEPFFAPSVVLDIKLAYILAKHGHRSQFRKEVDEEGARVRYFEHVRRVALVLFDEAKCTRPEMIVAALLHDGIEDTRDLTAEMIEHTFGADVCSIVKILSKTPPEGYLERFAMCKDWRPFVIKACDRLDNLRSLHQCDPSFVQRQITETREKYVPLFLQMVNLTPKNCKSDVERLFDTLLRTLIQLETTGKEQP